MHRLALIAALVLSFAARAAKDNLALSKKRAKNRRVELVKLAAP